ncbi:MAG: 4-hydroxy-3-methylbut-2-enyl diphosphate reductase [Coriobacteriales bacterium]|nr:4-hydroxy-3-methylbut-2-enyl diphosphate reductase [Coriobacteriales bacterium]
MPAFVIHIADHAGTCYGVERALRLVNECAAFKHNKPVYTLGPLIHNPRVVEELKNRQVQVIDSVEEAEPGSTVVIRSHGVKPEVYDDAARCGLHVVDATCPHVKVAHEAAKSFCEQNLQVIVVGEKHHPEVEAIFARAGAQAVIVSSPEDLEQVKLKNKIGIVVQTTQSQELLASIVCAVLPKTKELTVKNTICSATSERQQAVQQLARACDVMIVIGGRNSGNTRRLAQICAEFCEHTYHIESSHEILPEWLSSATNVGIAAGASTPQSHIQEAVSALIELGGSYPEQ